MNCFFLLDMSVKTCGKYLSIFKLIVLIQNTIAFWIGFVVPLILIIMGFIPLIKAIVSKKEIKKYIKKLFKNIALAALLFLICITINIMTTTVTCDTYRKDGIEYLETNCCLDRAKRQITKDEVRMVEFLVAIVVISFIFKKKSRKTVEKPTNI